MRVLVVGAGIAGLTLATCLQRQGHAVEVLERASALRGEGYMIDFFGSGFDVAERLGLKRELEGIHYGIAQLDFVKPDGEPRVSVPYARMRELLDGRHFNFMRGDLERVLADDVRDEVPIRFGARVTGIRGDATGAVVALEGGVEEKTDVVVGADGVHSTVRALIFGEEDRFVRRLGYHTAAFVLDDPGLREKIGDRFATLTVPGRQVAAYPIRGGRVATFWVHRASAPVVRASDDDARRELQETYGQLGWIVPELLAHAARTSGIYFDDVSQIELPSWSRDRVVLVGDACQCVSLLAGQGASMAMGAAYVLAREMTARADDLAEAFARYEARIKPSIAVKQRAGRRIARWFVPESGFRIGLRDAALRMSATGFGAWLLRRQIAGESVLTNED